MVRNLLSIPCMSAFKLVMMANVVMADLMGKIESEGKMEVGQVAPEEVGKSLRILGQFLPSFLLQE
ncbi:hypothetical protein CDL15_Pgr006398 [Punica granatum]|uniref:Uncharacterized protein n=1 Tax=Punica granatum TaxID=22663 RepID=A0A218VUY5_PUNGR|nr:hypothetical protein CDL15_Pgr006398 [Punica granatum]